MESYIAIIVAVIGAAVVLISNIYQKRNQLKFEQMKLKQEFYLRYIKALSDNMNAPTNKNFTIAENHAFNDLLLVASPKVLLSLYCFKNLVICHLKNGSIENYDNKYTEALTSLIKEIRLELHGKGERPNEGLKELYMLSGTINE